MSYDELVHHAVALLVRLRETRCEPDDAWAELLQLRAAHPGRYLQLVWERERYAAKLHYDLLIGHDEGVLSISYCEDDDLPWPTRGIQRIEECMVARVDGEPLDIARAMTSLDYAWHTLHIGRHLIDMSLIEQERRARQISVEDDEVEPDLAEFRIKRQLFTSASVERWMAEHGVSHVQLSQHLREQAAQRKLRRVVTGGDAACDAYFANYRRDFDRVQVARIFLPGRERAEALLGQLRVAPAGFLPAAQRAFLDDEAAGDVFATWRRSELDPMIAGDVFATESGAVVPRVLPSGEGFELVQVLRHVPADLDERTRAEIAALLFRRWLDERRALARVEWFWGGDEAADIPSLRL